MVSRHSALYSPLISSIAGGFLEEEGIQVSYDVLGAGQRSHVLIRDRIVDVMQSAVSSNWKPTERGGSRRCRFISLRSISAMVSFSPGGVPSRILNGPGWKARHCLRITGCSRW